LFENGSGSCHVMRQNFVQGVLQEIR
jgi:hypothetical protein